MKWVYFPLHPDTPLEGLPLKDLFAGRGLDLEAMHARMKGLMDAEGLPYNRRTNTYNSRLAQELAKWADSKPGFEAIHPKLYQAYFVDGLNLADPNVLVPIAGPKWRRRCGPNPGKTNQRYFPGTSEYAFPSNRQRSLSR